MSLGKIDCFLWRVDYGSINVVVMKSRGRSISLLVVCLAVSYVHVCTLLEAKLDVVKLVDLLVKATQMLDT